MMITTEQLEQIKLVQCKIDDIIILSLLQKDFMKLIYWSCENYGKYIYNKKNVLVKYDKLKDDFDIEKEIQSLFDNGIIYLENKRTIFKGDYITLKHMKINKDVLEKLIRDIKY